jgi:hypothetical protein
MKFKINRRRIRQVYKVAHGAKKIQLWMMFKFRKICRRVGKDIHFSEYTVNGATAMPNAVTIPTLDIPALSETAAMIEEKSKQWQETKDLILGKLYKGLGIPKEYITGFEGSSLANMEAHCKAQGWIRKRKVV